MISNWLVAGTDHGCSLRIQLHSPPTEQKGHALQTTVGHRTTAKATHMRGGKLASLKGGRLDDEQWKGGHTRHSKAHARSSRQQGGIGTFCSTTGAPCQVQCQV